MGYGPNGNMTWEEAYAGGYRVFVPARRIVRLVFQFPKTDRPEVCFILYAYDTTTKVAPPDILAERSDESAWHNFNQFNKLEYRPLREALTVDNSDGATDRHYWLACFEKFWGPDPEVPWTACSRKRLRENGTQWPDGTPLYNYYWATGPLEIPVVSEAQP